MIRLLSLLCLVSMVCSQDLSGPTYENKTRSEKSQMVWSRVLKDITSNTWPNAVQLGELFVESMNTSFITKADEMPKQYIGRLFTRSKLVHTVGVVVKVTLNIESNPYNYTGIFAGGSDQAVMRFSAAAKPDPTDKANVITPGLALKCFRDRVISGNFFAMYSLLGQPTTNFFAHDFSNHPPNFGSWAPIALKAIKSRFGTASKWPSMTGLSDLARYDQFGRSTARPNFPYRVVFHPSTKLHTSIPNNSQNYFTGDIVRSISQGDAIFTLWAQDQPGSQLTRIGTVIANSNPTTSTFGDKGLFHQHTQMEADLALKPQWEAAALKEVNYQAATKGFQYQDLPWN